MTISLRGIVLSVGLISTVIETGSAGMSIQVTPTALSGPRAGEETLVHTEMVAREGPLTLFDFASTNERDSFHTLMNAKGVEAKLALVILAVHAPNALRRAIASQDVTALIRIPGLGLRGARRVILNVTDKPGPVTGGDLRAARTVAQGVQGMEAMSDSGPEPHASVAAAPAQLGQNEVSAQQAISSVTVDIVDGGREPDMVAMPRASLRWLGGGYHG